MLRLFTFAFFYLFSYFALAQYSFEFDTIEVTGEQGPLSYAWAGGLNSAQFGAMDLNGDGVNDLVVFDRMGNKVNAFLNDENNYIYSPAYESFFPSDLEGWVILQDYNCDGKKDIFTNTLFGIKVYKNISSGDLPQWELAADPIFTSGSSGDVNLQVNITDIPGIADLDNDGDLDILVYNFAVGGYIRYHRNLSVERYGNCENLEFERASSQWGEFEECECDLFAFQEEGCEDIDEDARIMHAGGKTMLLIDQDGDGDKDLVMSQEDCDKLYYLENQGDPTNALMLDFSPNYPNETHPAHFQQFPAAFYEDVNFDGVPDLLSSPNLSTDPNYAVNFSRSSWLFVNTGTGINPEFEFVKSNFLQEQMIDEGAYARPFFADYDGDGDQDMFIAANGFEKEGTFYGKIALYENTGSSVQPKFRKTEDDYLGLSNLELVDLKPSFADINSDGIPDLVIPSKSIEPVSHQIHYLINQNASGTFDFQITQLRTLPLDYNAADNPFLSDVNGDGLTDVILGKLSGRMEFYRNTGNPGSPSFALENDNFAGIDDNFMHRSPSPHITDLNNDGRRELIATDNSGAVRIVEDFLSAETEGKTLVLHNPVTDEMDTSRFGYYSQNVAVDLYNSGFPVIVIGSSQGGVYALKNTGDTGANAPSVAIAVSPNPSLGGEQIEITVSQDAVIQVISMLGQPAITTRLGKDEILAIDPDDFATGIYIVRAVVSRKNTASAKILILP